MTKRRTNAHTDDPLALHQRPTTSRTTARTDELQAPCPPTAVFCTKTPKHVYEAELSSAVQNAIIRKAGAMCKDPGSPKIIVMCHQNPDTPITYLCLVAEPITE